MVDYINNIRTLTHIRINTIPVDLSTGTCNKEVLTTLNYSADKEHDHIHYYYDDAANNIVAEAIHGDDDVPENGIIFTCSGAQIENIKNIHSIFANDVQASDIEMTCFYKDKDRFGPNGHYCNHYEVWLYVPNNKPIMVLSK